MSLSLKLLCGRPGWQKSYSSWKKLYASAATHPFVHPRWIHVVCQGERRWDQLRLLLFFQRGKLIAILPLFQLGRYLLSASSFSAGFSDPLIAPGAESLFVQGLRIFLKRVRRPIRLERQCEPFFPSEIPYRMKKEGATLLTRIPDGRENPPLSSFRLLEGHALERHFPVALQAAKKREDQRVLEALASATELEWRGVGALFQGGRIADLCFLLFEGKALALLWSTGAAKRSLMASLEAWGAQEGFTLVHDVEERGGMGLPRSLYTTTLWAPPC